MADYHTAVVVVPEIPASDLTPLERQVLSLAMGAVEGDGGVSFRSFEGLSDIVSIDPGDLRSAWTASQAADSRLNRTIHTLLTAFDATDEADKDSYIAVQLTDGLVGIAEILQDVVRRSQTVREIVLIMSFISTGIGVGGHGGSVTRITADAVQYDTTGDVLARTRKDLST
ncbi:hypothetical protein ELI02_28270 (plasmid) [Rhizobium leguminosarum]|uniref:hypothetical protein n=1 Tax=Rhizobium leguminosarum TaxID=384 RepID=UPI00102FB36A|nr:hypothetical protein [Rhizobium leguminosarum]TAV41597.1 hypothetical protein ELI29_33850 [Rhizobium leguminosarum]TAX02024.1 hypothetical protein ELI07_33125 [Rhizobium leguminosarum]TAX22818.1 hypothetical protein ELI04_33025 [Rhizobium leguminosarum]TAX45652.1 hypothetical protein ELI02_28270 [Rhizobium leguminosarum]TAX46630.1 hypothetical protein ELI01_31290 [Rhizobium leguminosarum]